MKAPFVGIIGCGGAVGSVACNILHRSFNIRGGQRRHPTGPSIADIDEWMRVDVYNPESIANFCSGCNVILNCAGPSYRIGDRIALAAIRAGASYVDVFGADYLEKSLLKKKKITKGMIVLSAGVFPGLSGVLPLWLFGRGFESVETISSFGGGREYSSLGAAADLLLSSIAGFGIPDAYWLNGDIFRKTKNFSEAVSLPGFKGDVYAQDFLTSEFIKLSKRLGLREAHWHVVYADKHILDTVSTCCYELLSDSSDASLDRTVNELVSVVSMAMNGRIPWYTMMTELQGIKQGKVKRERAILKSSNSYKLSGVVAAATVESVLRKNTSEGIYWAFEIIDNDELISKIKEDNETDYLEVVEIAPIDDFTDIRHYDEGVL